MELHEFWQEVNRRLQENWFNQKYLTYAQTAIKVIEEIRPDLLKGICENNCDPFLVSDNERKDSIDWERFVTFLNLNW